MSRDRRMRVLEAALFNPDLSYAERTFMAVVTALKAEHIGGEPRHGSRAMGPDGKFSLHLDYLASALATSAEGVRKVRRSLEAKGLLGHVHDGTYGRPPTWEARVVRGAKNGSLTSGRKGTPYGLAGWLTRVAEKAPHTYREPDHPDQAPAPRAVTPYGARGAAKRNEGHQAPDHLAACPFHEGGTGAPEDCICTPANRRRYA